MEAKREEKPYLLSGEILGITAGALVTVSIIPQLIRVFKLKSAHEISLPFTIMLVVGFVFWAMYGFAIEHTWISMWNVVAICLTGLLLFAKLKYGR